MKKRIIKKWRIIFFVMLFLLITFEIVVVFSNNKKTTLVVSCSGLSQEECWNTQLTNTIRGKGISQAFVLFNKLNTENKEFARDCHSFAHTLGREAYVIYQKENQKIPFSDQMSVCGYGFFHGLLEVVASKNDNPDIVRKFCDTYREDGKKGRNFYECFHGVGHGAVARHERKSSEGSQATQQALDTCQDIATTDREMEYCARGVFMRLETEPFLKIDRTKDKIDKLGLLAYCEGQTGDYAKWCYQAEGRFLYVRANYNFEEAAAHIENAKDVSLKKVAVYEFAISVSKGSPTRDLGKEVISCQALQKEIRQECINGLVAGVLLYGQTPQDINKADVICSDENLRSEHKNGCKKEIENAMTYFTQS